MAGIIVKALAALEATEKAAVRMAPRPGFVRFAPSKADSMLEEVQKAAAYASSKFGRDALISLNLEEIRLLDSDLL